MVAYAKTIDEVIAIVTTEILQPIVLLLFALATILFFWGVVEFLINRDNEEERDKGKRHMLWGIVGLVIMFSVNGILWVLINFAKIFNHMNFYLIPIAHAQTVGSIVDTIIDFLDSIIPILFLIATIVFLWGIILFITSGGDEEKRKEGRQYIIFGLIGLFVMVAIWGIVEVLVDFFDFGGIGAPSLPDLPGRIN